MAKRELAFISRDKDGNIIYDFNKFNSIDEAILEEWKFSSNSLFDNASLEEIAEIIYDKDSFIKVYRPNNRSLKWTKFIIDLSMRLRKLNKEKHEVCICEKLLDKISDSDNPSEVIGSDGHYTWMSMDLYKNANTGELMWNIEASGDDTTYAPIKYCPFCGKKLPRTIK